MTKVAVAGAGYVGLVTAACLARLGHDVTVAERDPTRRALIVQGRAPFFEPGLDAVLESELATGRLKLVETVGEAAVRADVTFIAVGTPDRDGEIDLSQVRHAALEIGASLRLHRRPHAIVVKSTVVPGTTTEFVGPLVAQASGRARDGFGLAMNPEFLREGTSLDDFMNPDRIVIGADDAFAEWMLADIYTSFTCPKIVTNARSAELTKYMNNALLATLVSFTNEMAGFAERTGGIDFDAVLAGVHADRRLTPMAVGAPKPGILSYLKPSAGFGGSCLPKDISALRAAARGQGIAMPMLDAAVQVNATRARAVVNLLAQQMDLGGKRIALLGAAFKAGTDDLRFAASLTVAAALAKAGARIVVHDALCTPGAMTPLFPLGTNFAATLDDAVALADAAIVLTAEPFYRDAPWATLGTLMRRPLLLDIWDICRSANEFGERLRLGHAPQPTLKETRHATG
jgi:UDPglucose 6-dehydrogenase/GDP-mannose 6-dehydrogenase